MTAREIHVPNLGDFKNVPVIEVFVKPGDTVLMPKYGGTEIKLDGKDFQIMREEDILGILG